MAEFLVADVSRHNEVSSFAKLKEAGVWAVILRAGYGRETSQKDTKFEEYYAAARQAGLHIGAYWYSYADGTADALREASACLSCIAGKAFDFPVYYDMEESSMAALGKETLSEMAAAFCTALENAGYWAGVYANTNWFTNYLDANALSARYTLWLADYRQNYNTSLPRDMHQYTSKGQMAGVSGYIDLSRCTRDFPAEIGALDAPAASAPSASETAKCTGENVNLRSEAHTGSAVLGQVNKGDTVFWLADDGWGWSKVAFGSVTGWMVNQYLNRAGLSGYKVGECTGNHVRVRSGPGTGYAVRRTLNRGNLFRIICILPGGWYQVDVGGNWGYVSGEYVKVR